jgi:hypothetical protein
MLNLIKNLGMRHRITLLSFIVYVYTPAGDIDLLYKVLQLVEDFATIILPPLTLSFFLVFPRPIVRHRGLFAAIWIPPALLGLWNLDLLVFGNRVAVAAPKRSFELIQRWEIAHFAIYFTLAVVVRDVARPAHVARLPFVPTHYYRG